MKTKITPDQRRESFIFATAEQMQLAGLITRRNRNRVAEWLRTVWFEARGEEWGEDAAPESGPWEAK